MSRPLVPNPPVPRRANQLSWREVLADAAGAEAARTVMPIPEPTHPAVRLATPLPIVKQGRVPGELAVSAAWKRLVRARAYLAMLVGAGAVMLLGGKLMHGTFARVDTASGATAMEAAERATAQLEAFVNTNRKAGGPAGAAVPPRAIPLVPVQDKTLPRMPANATGPSASPPAALPVRVPAAPVAPTAPPPRAAAVRTVIPAENPPAPTGSPTSSSRPDMVMTSSRPPFEVERIVEVEGLLRAQIRRLDAANASGARYAPGALLADGWELAGVEADNVVVIGRDNVQHRLSAAGNAVIEGNDESVSRASKPAAEGETASPGSL